MNKVMIHPATYENVNEAVERAFALFPLSLEGKRVLIKPNVLRASRADEGIVTHPAVLHAVVSEVEKRRPAGIVVGDNPGVMSYGANEESFAATGLADAAKGYYRNIGNDAVGVPFNPRFMPSVSVSRAVVEADVIISLPKFKTHGLTVVTGAIKNCYGYLPGAQKARLHKAAGSPSAFHEMVAEVFRLRPPDLFIMDAVVGMQGNGPASTDLRHIGLILSSDNGVALDAVVAAMMGCRPESLPFLRRAKDLGLGDHDLRRIEIIGEFKPLPDFKLPPLNGEQIHGNAAMQSLLEQRTRLRPQADADLCTACGTCVQQCPAGALMMADGLPEVDQDKCITCFCCQEMCPSKAMALK